MAKDHRGKKVDPTYLNSLPKMKFVIAGQPLVGRYDPEKHEVFILDGNGNVVRHATGIVLSEQQQKDSLIPDENAPKPAPTVPPVDPARTAPANPAPVQTPAPTQAPAPSPVQTNEPQTAPAETATFEGIPGMVSTETASATPTPSSDNQRDVPPENEPPADLPPSKKKGRKKKERKKEKDADDGWSGDDPLPVPEPGTKQRSKGKTIVICSILLVVVGGALFFWQFGQLDQLLKPSKPMPPTDPSSNMNEPLPSEQTEPVITETVPPETTVPVETTAPTEGSQPTEESVPTTYVLKARDILLPGHVISIGDFEEVGLNSLEYQTLTAGGGFYTAQELERLEGLVIINYVPAGKYLSYDDVSTFYSPSNPWGVTDTQQVIITLPIVATAENLNMSLWGNSVDITITVETKLQSNAEVNNVEPPAGIQHESSTVESILVDTYKLKASAIIDVLDAGKESLFSRYSALASIPVVFRQDYLAKAYMSNPDMMEADKPCFIQIVVPAEQGELLSSLNQENMEVIISQPTQNNSTDLQRSTYASLQETGAVIAKIWQAASEE